jgi:peptidoglycan hydrolase FlgJ
MMTAITPQMPISLDSPSRTNDWHALHAANSQEAQAAKDEKLHSTFTQFVGQTFFGQMIKSMRSTVGHAAYFNGGQGEKIFQGLLDQTFSEQMTKASADRFADPLFHQQFPYATTPADKAVAAKPTASLNDLGQLSRR